MYKWVFSEHLKLSGLC